MKKQLAAAVKHNLRWFRRSGIMRPDDGFWGVGERIAIIAGNASWNQINLTFPIQTPLDEHTVVIEHRRADCCTETAMLFELAARHFNRPADHRVAANIVAFLKRSGLRVTETDSPLQHLWRWAMPNCNGCWTDDNSWVITGFLFLAAHGYPELEPWALAAAETMYGHMDTYLKHIENGHRDEPATETMSGSRLNPHWMGLVTMALAWAYSRTGKTEYYELTRRYYAVVLDGPPAFDLQARVKDPQYPWSISEYAYLTLVASITAHTYRNADFRQLAQKAAAIPVERQFETGHFASNHYEAPEGKQFADLIYTQNWATLGLQHAARLCPERTEYRQALAKSLAFLLQIQDCSGQPFFDGCWRGMFDTAGGTWGGGDKYEGGQNSIYSGWTNAPISLAMLFELTGESLFPQH